MKQALLVTAIDKSLIKKDYVATFYNGSKTFSELDLNIIRYRFKALKNQSLTTFGRLKQNIFYTTNEIISSTDRFMKFRNLTSKMSLADYQYINFNVFSRALNKQLFINVLHNVNNFLFSFPCLIMYHFKKRSRVRVYNNVGFRLIFKKKRMGLLLEGSNLVKHRYKRKRKLKIRHSRYYKRKLKKVKKSSLWFKFDILTRNKIRKTLFRINSFKRNHNKARKFFKMVNYTKLKKL